MNEMSSAPQTLTRVALVVCGMHRSGTSALARVCSLLGAELPRAVVPGNEGNPKGHWEPQRIVELNDEMLASAGSDLYSVTEVHDGWFTSPLIPSFTERATDIVRAEFANAPLIILKDPRTCLFLPIWNEALRAAGYRVHFLLPLRSPTEVADSLRRRHLKAFPYDAWARPRGELVWLRYSIKAEQFTRGQSRTVVRFSSLLENWRAEMDRVARDGTFTWPRLSARSGQEVDEFLDGQSTEYRSGAPSSAHLATPPEELTSVELATAFFERISTEAPPEDIDRFAAEHQRRTSRLQDLITTFEDLYPVVWRFFEQGREQERLRQLDQSTRERLQEAVQQLWGHLDAANNDKLTLSQDLQNSGGQVKELTSALQQVGDALRRVDQDKAELSNALEAVGDALRRVNAERDDLCRALEREEVRRKELESSKADLTQSIATLVHERNLVAREHEERIATLVHERNLAAQGHSERVASLEAANHELHEALAEAKLQLHQLLSSTSWRFARPLRGVSRLLRRLR